MFTGLIQTVGTLQIQAEDTVKITCSTRLAGISSTGSPWSPASGGFRPADLELGDSISVDGVCLTVTQILQDGFLAAVSPETLRRTTLGRRSQNLSASDSHRVNLESSLRVGSKLGGHFVTGHIDGVGYLEASVPTANAWEMSFHAPDPRISRYIVPKGSIAINGISLTVADCDPTGSHFRVAVIPLTYAETNLGQLEPGDPVNLEGDVLGKYVEKFLRLESGSQVAPVAELEGMLASEGNVGVTPEFLAEHGYLG